MKTLFMETTEISPEKTISEIEAVLIQCEKGIRPSENLYRLIESQPDLLKVA